MDPFEALLFGAADSYSMFNDLFFWMIILPVVGGILQYLLPFFMVRSLLGGYYGQQQRVDPVNKRKNLAIRFGIFLSVIGIILMLLGFGDNEMNMSFLGMSIENATPGIVVLGLGLFLMIMTFRKENA